MVQLIVPPLGESITEAVIARWLKQVGEAVAIDEPVVDLETDKITVQLPSPIAGVIGQQLVAVGDTVKVGQVVGVVEEGAAKVEAKPAEAKADAKAAKADPPGDIKAAKTSDANPAAASAKATEPQPAGKAPVVAAGAAVAAASGAGTGGAGNGAATAAASAGPSKDELLRLTPSQRAAAREHGALPAARSAPSAPTASAPAGEDPLPQNLHPGDEVVKMSPLRKRIAERLVQAQRDTASLTTFNEVDMTAVMELRSRYKESFEKTHGVKLGFMSFFVKACVSAAKLFPGVNAEVVGSHIVYKKHYDFGIAVSTPKGLVVPVLRGCDERSFAEVESGINQLAERARTSKLSLDDLTGGTFSITNGGIYGSMMSTPLLNFPQSGILGMHNIVRRAVVIGEKIEIRPMMYVALTYDHRVVDGREAVSFLVAVKDRLEAPERMLLES
jgi:2-oxoglutarate dehydrogenase E2 component (dihydrolipoamide succinyltransferase)